MLISHRTYYVRCTISNEKNKLLHQAGWVDFFSLYDRRISRRRWGGGVLDYDICPPLYAKQQFSS